MAKLERKLKEILNKERTVTSVADEFKVSRQTVYKWLDAYEKKGSKAFAYKKFKAGIFAEENISTKQSATKATNLEENVVPTLTDDHYATTETSCLSPKILATAAAVDIEIPSVPEKEKPEIINITHSDVVDFPLNNRKNPVDFTVKIPSIYSLFLHRVNQVKTVAAMIVVTFVVGASSLYVGRNEVYMLATGSEAASAATSAETKSLLTSISVKLYCGINYLVTSPENWKCKSISTLPNLAQVSTSTANLQVEKFVSAPSSLKQEVATKVVQSSSTKIVIKEVVVPKVVTNYITKYVPVPGPKGDTGPQGAVGPSGSYSYVPVLTFNGPGSSASSQNLSSPILSSAILNGISTFTDSIIATGVTANSLIVTGTSTFATTTASTLFADLLEAETASTSVITSDNLTTADAVIINSTTTNAFVTSLFGAGLSACNNPGDKLIWNDGAFACGVDAGAGGGITQINGSIVAGQTLTATSTGGLSLSVLTATTTGVHTFALGIASGYFIPQTASTTDWNNFFNRPTNYLTAGSNIILSGTSTISVSANPLFASIISSSSTLGTTTLSSLFASGNVGIGTVNPNGKLEVSGITYLGDISTTAQHNQGVIVYTGNTANADKGVDIIRGTSWDPISVIGLHLKSDAVGNYRGALGFANGTTSTEQMTFASNGNIGIGTTTPSQKLSISGNMQLTGAIFDGSNASGTVGQVLASNGASTYWTTIAGTIGNGTLTNQTLYWDGSAWVANGNFTVNAAGNATATTITSSELTVVNSLNLSHTTSSSLGVIYKYGTQFLHDYQPVGAAKPNLFLGLGAGNFSMGSSTGPSYLAGENTGIGRSSLGSLTTGFYNTGLGGLALGWNQTGFSNTALGVLSLYYNTSGSGNTAVGLSALNKNNGNYNVGIGQNAGSSVATGTSNTFIGSETAAALASAVTSSNNTLLGYRSGYNMGTTTGNLFLGYRSGYDTTTGDYNILLGYNNNLASTTGSNQLNIGNLIYGTSLGINGVLATGNVGIGTSTPTSKLSIQTTSNIDPLLVSSSTGSTLFSILANGNVGIGNANPATGLHIGPSIPLGVSGAANAFISGTLELGGSMYMPSAGFADIGGVGMIFRPTANAVIPAVTIKGKDTLGALANALSIDSTWLSSTPGSTIARSIFNIYDTSAREVMRFESDGAVGHIGLGGITTSNNLLSVNGQSYFSGSVGIGTSTPDSLLNIFGTSTQLKLSYGIATSTTLNTLIDGRLEVRPSSGWSYLNTLSKNNGLFVYNTLDTDSYSAVTGNLVSLRKNGTTTVQFINNSAGQNFINSGNFGIGTTTPSQLFTVGDNNQFTVSSTGAVSSAGINVYGGINLASYGVYKWGPGNIGAPDTGISRISQNVIGIGNSSASDYSGTLVSGSIGVGTATPSSLLSIVGTSTKDLFSVSSSSGASLFSILANGNLGIGTSTPDSLLTIFGSSSQLRLSYSASTSTTLNTLSDGRFEVKPDSGWSYFNSPSKNNGLFVYNTLDADSYSAVMGSQISLRRNGANTVQITNSSAYGKNYINSGNLGIGTTTPTSLLSIVGTSTEDLFSVASSSGYSFFNILANGNIGIGTTTPSAVLQVQGSGANTDFRIGRTANANYLSISAPSGESFLSFLGINGSSVLGLSGAGGVALGSYANTDAGAGNLILPGSIGIGTTTPVYKLDVIGTGRFTGSLTTDYINTSSSTATSMFIGGINIASSSFAVDSITGITDISNLSMGVQTFEADAGMVSWIDMAVTAASTAGTIESYSAMLDSNPVFTVYGESDGIDGIQNLAFGIGTTTPSASLFVQGNGNNKPFIIASSTGLSLMTMLPNGNLGIGSSTPSASLSLQASENVNPLVISSSSGASLFTVLANGNIGIGTSTPFSMLDINAPVTAFGTTQMRISDGTSTGYFAISEGSSGVGAYLPTLTGLSSGLGGYGMSLLGLVPTAQDSNVAVAGAIVIDGRRADNTSLLASNILNIRNNGASLMVVDKSGNVGIGTTSPLAKLDIWGNLNVATGSIPSLFVNTASSRVGIGTNNPSVALDVVGAISGSTNVYSMNGAVLSSLSGDAVLRTYSTQNLRFNAGVDASVPHMMLTTAGNLGVGTSTPSSLLSVSSSTATGTSHLFEVSGSTTTPLFNVLANGNVGIGKLTPVSTLDLVNKFSAANQIRMTSIGQNVGLIGYNPSSIFEFTGSSNSQFGPVKFDFGSNFAFMNGNVGIGTTSPESKLDVYQATSTSNMDIFRLLSDVGSAGNTVFRIDSDGDIFTDGGTTIGNPADVAENYSTKEVLLPGTVVALATTTSPWALNENAQASTTYDMSQVRTAHIGDQVFGVISTRPGILLGGNTVSGVPVALSGRVPVKVTNENGEVKRGDYLVLSTSTPGYAMKMLKSGKTLGRVLSDTFVDTATGTVLVAIETKEHTFTLFGSEGLTTLSVATSTAITPEMSMSVADMIAESIRQGEEVISSFVTMKVSAAIAYIDTIFTKNLHAENVETNVLCVGTGATKTCIDKATLDQILLLRSTASTNASVSGTNSDSSSNSTGSSSVPVVDTASPTLTTPDTSTTTIPVIDVASTTTP